MSMIDDERAIEILKKRLHNGTIRKLANNEAKLFVIAMFHRGETRRQLGDAAHMTKQVSNRVLKKLRGKKLMAKHLDQDSGLMIWEAIMPVGESPIVTDGPVELRGLRGGTGQVQSGERGHSDRGDKRKLKTGRTLARKDSQHVRR